MASNLCIVFILHLISNNNSLRVGKKRGYFPLSLTQFLWALFFSTWKYRKWYQPHLVATSAVLRVHERCYPSVLVLWLVSQWQEMMNYMSASCNHDMYFHLIFMMKTVVSAQITNWSSEKLSSRSKFTTCGI